VSPAALGVGFAAIGMTAATAAVATAVVYGAVIGAAVGFATSLITGKDPLKGALTGAVVGGVSGGVAGAIGGAATAGTEVAGAGIAGTEGGIGGVGAPAAAQAGLEGSAAVAGGSGVAPASGVAGSAPAAETGLLSGATNWINKNPMAAAMVSQGIGGVASGIAENRAADKELDALMKRDKLNYANQEISGLTAIELKTTLPSVGVFTEKPKWQMPDAGLISQWNGGKNATA